MWDATVSGRGAGADFKCVEVLHKVSAGITDRKAWGDAITVTTEEAAALQEKMDKIHARDANGETVWFKGAVSGGKGFVWMASDASDSTMAVVHLAETGAKLVIDPWSELPKARHIYFKELEAARAAVVWACENYPGHVIALATDNMAVFWAIKRRLKGHKRTYSASTRP